MKLYQNELPLAENLLYFAVVFLPFQQALSLNVGFPLKISEVIGVVAVTLLSVERRRPTFQFHGQGKLIVLGIALALSTVVALLAELPVPVSPGYSGGFIRDLLQYAIYGFLVVIIGWQLAVKLGAEFLGKAICLGLRLATAYCVLQLSLWLLGVESLLRAVNGTFQGGTAFGAIIPRNGPFLEGNYLGFFAGVSLLVALKRKDNFGIAAGVFCLLYSQSTIGIFGLVAALFFSAAMRPSGKAAGIFSFLASLAAVTITFLPIANRLVSHQLGKLGFGEFAETGGSVSYSLRARTFNTEAGMAMGYDNPIFGVGPGRFGVWQPLYADFTGLPPGYRAGLRPLVGNAYIQIFAEIGIVAAVAFCILILALVWKAWTQGHPLDLALAAFVAIGLNATPAWTVLPVWVTVAYLASNKVGVRPKAMDFLRPLERPDVSRIAPRAAKPPMDPSGLTLLPHKPER